MPTPRDAVKGVVLILLASLFFGVSGPFAKVVMQAGLTPLQVTWLRVLGVGVILAIVAVPVMRRQARPPLLAIALFGLTAVAGVQACYFLAVERLPVGIALLLEFMGPVLVVVWIRWVRRTRLSRAAITGTLLSIAGLCVVVEIWSGVRLDLIGLLAGAGAAMCQATYFLGGEKLASQVDVRVLLAVGFGVATIALAPLAAPWSMDWAALSQPVRLAGVGTVAGVSLAALIICTALAYGLGLPSLRLLSAPVAGAMGYTEVVVAALAAWMLLGEALTTPQILGGLVVIAGVFTAQRAVATREKSTCPGGRHPRSRISRAVTQRNSAEGLSPTGTISVISSSCSAVGWNRLAATLASTCSGLEAPAITEAQPGSAAIPPMATSNRPRPLRSAQAMSSSI